MALLPRTGKSYIPSALQHLMEAGSPVADVFDICETCEQLAAENHQVNAVCVSLPWQQQLIYIACKLHRSSDNLTTCVDVRSYHCF